MTDFLPVAREYLDNADGYLLAAAVISAFVGLCFVGMCVSVAMRLERREVPRLPVSSNRKAVRR